MGGKSSKTTNNYTQNNNKLTNIAYNKNTINESLRETINEEQHTENMTTLIQNVVAMTMTDVMSDANFNFNQHNMAIFQFAKRAPTCAPLEEVIVEIDQSNDAVTEVSQTVSNISNTTIANKVSKKLTASIDMATQLINKLDLTNLIGNNGNSQGALDASTESKNQKSTETNSGIGGTAGKAIGGLADVAGNIFAFGSSKSESDNNTCINNNHIRNSNYNINTSNTDKETKYSDVMRDINKNFEQNNSNEKAVNKISNALKTAMSQTNSFAAMNIPCNKTFDAEIEQENNMLAYVKQDAVTTVINEIVRENIQQQDKALAKFTVSSTREEVTNALRNVTKLASQGTSNMIAKNMDKMKDKEGSIEKGFGDGLKAFGEGISGNKSDREKKPFPIKLIAIVVVVLLVGGGIFFMMKKKGGGDDDGYMGPPPMMGPPMY